MNIRYYRNLFEGIAQGLYLTHTKNEYADQVVPNLLKQNQKWGSKDRRFVASAIYDITRYFRKYKFAASLTGELNKVNYWKVIAAWLVEIEKEFPKWKEFSEFDRQEFQNKFEQAKSIFEIEQSIPDWLNKFGEQALGKDLWQQEITSLNKEAEVVLRVNPLAVPKNKKNNALTFVQQELLKQNIQTELVSDLPFALQLTKRRSIIHTKPYANGWFEIQDANSQKVGAFTNATENMVVVDACAGAGGKSLQLASKMNNRGAIYSFDILDWKLKELNKRATKAKSSIIETKSPGLENLGSLVGRADLVLIDAPCSGLGTLKRKADLKWKVSIEFIEQMLKTQQQVLETYSKLVKPGGELVYATCSILPQENTEQINSFLNNEENKEFNLENEQQLFAHTTGYDGFYMAKLKRAN